MRVEGPEPAWRQPSSTDLASFGKHYLIRSYGNPRVLRHYTAAACMKRDAYDQYVGLIRQFQENNALPGRFYSFNEGVLPESQPEIEVIFVCKNYKIEGGLSHRLHNHSQQEDLCQIKALMGKGLGIASSGTHIAFAAGTGLLPFMDFVALLLRINLGLFEEDNPDLPKFDSSFKFVLYVSFESRKDAIALELLEGLYEITQKKGLKNFDLVVRVSSEKEGTRWDEEFIRRQFVIRSKHEVVERVWVCGPPAMNECFDRAFESIRNGGSQSVIGSLPPK